MKSFITSENEKMTTVRIPGSEIGKTMRTSVFTRDAPSTRAASSSSRGIVLKKPISSHVENGTVNEGKTSTSDQSESCRPRSPPSGKWLITYESGRKSRVGGTR